MRNVFFALLFLLSINNLYCQVYKDSTRSVDERIDDLISRMTTEEKFWQLFMIPGDIYPDQDKYKNGIFGFQVNSAGTNTDVSQQILAYSAGENAYKTARKINAMQKYFVEETRLGIPFIPFDETLHGLIRDGATSFPQAIGLAATWDTELMHDVATAIGKESKSRGIKQVLSPVVNIANDVRWGRTEETYGEDPFLVSEMGVAYISAFEEMNIIATPKHFVANVGDGGRDSYPIQWNERHLRETHFIPFKAAILKAGARSIMTAYNSYNGSPCTANSWLLQDVLKDEWNFNGFVISDAGGTGGANVLHMTAKDYSDATAQSIKNGLDVIFQTNYEHYKLFSPPFYDGSIPEETLNAAVRRVLRLKFELGLFENPYVDPIKAKDWNGNPQHKAIALNAALESIVLLKNENQTLPISKHVKSIALIGPEADTCRLGGYSGPGNNKVSLLDGLSQHIDDDIKLFHTQGCERNKKSYHVIPSEYLACYTEEGVHQGLKGEYFNNVNLKGEAAFSRIDPSINFQWTLFSPNPEKLGNDFFSVRWTGKINTPETKKVKIGIEGNDGYRFYINNELLIDNWAKQSHRTKLVEYKFKKGNDYSIRIEYHEPFGNSIFKLVWDYGVSDETKEIKKACQIAKKCDLAIIAVGIEEGEFQDRGKLSLPGNQEKLIKEVAATGTKVAVVIIGGSAVEMTAWMDDISTILTAWYPGEEGGNAIAQVLLGDYNPGGKLPITWPVHEGQLPLVYNHKPTGRGDDYINLTGEPLFPFGYGLSYTSFDYENIQLSSDHISKSESTFISIDITNTGSVAGDEVVQLYIKDKLASVARPIIELKGFRRVHIKPKEKTTIQFEITPQMLSMLNKSLNTVVEPGEFEILIGSSSKDIQATSILTVK